MQWSRGALALSAVISVCLAIDFESTAIETNNLSAIHTLPPTSSHCGGCLIIETQFEFVWNSEVYTQIAATVVKIVNNATNVTRTSTVYGTAFDLPLTTLIVAEAVSDLVITTKIAAIDYTLTYPTAYKGITEVESVTYFPVTDRAGQVQCVSSARYVTRPFLLEVYASLDNLLSTLAPQDCEREALSPPTVLVPVLKLTETETTYENAPARQTPTVAKPGQGKPIMAPTVTLTRGSISIPTETPPRLNRLRPTTAAPLPTDRAPAPSGYIRPDSKAVDVESPPARTDDEIAGAGKPSSDEETSDASRPRIMAGDQGGDEPDRNPPRLLSIGSRVISANLDGNFVIAEQTLAPGGPPITAFGKSIYLQPSAAAVVIDGVTVSLTQAPSQPRNTNAAILPIGSSLITANPQGKLVIADQTLVPGGSPVTALGNIISLQPSGLAAVIDGSTVSLVPGPHIVKFGSQALVKEESDVYRIESQTLMPGNAPITVDGVPFSLAPSASALMIGSSTIVPQAAPRVLTFGDQVLTPVNAGGYVIGGQTLIPGDEPITVDRTPFSLAPSASALVVDTSIVAPEAVNPSLLRFDHRLLMADGAGGYVLGSQTLVPGYAPITIAGTAVSLAPSGSALIIGSDTLTPKPVPTLPAILVHQVIEPVKTASERVIAGQTLVPGAPPVSISGQPVSLAEGESHVVIGSSTKSLPSEGSGLASLILHGFGDVNPEASPTETDAGSPKVVSGFTGDADRWGKGKMEVVWMALSLCMGFGLLSLI